MRGYLWAGARSDLQGQRAADLWELITEGCKPLNMGAGTELGSSGRAVKALNC